MACNAARIETIRGNELLLSQATHDPGFRRGTNQELEETKKRSVLLARVGKGFLRTMVFGSVPLRVGKISQMELGKCSGQKVQLEYANIESTGHQRN